MPVEIDNVIHQVYVLKRPYVDEFLCRMGELFECVLFTASLAKVRRLIFNLNVKCDFEFLPVLKVFYPISIFCSMNSTPIPWQIFLTSGMYFIHAYLESHVSFIKAITSKTSVN